MSSDVAAPSSTIKLEAMSPEAIDDIRRLEAISLAGVQLPVATYHLIHAGMYHRTITIPAGGVLTGAVIKRATTLIFSGDALVATGGQSYRLTGYHVLAGSAQHKQAFVAIEATHLTMIFPTSAKDVEAAEAEFTDEGESLMSRHGNENIVTITGE